MIAEFWSALPRVLWLVGDVDSVELKVTVAQGRHLVATAALGIDPLKAHIRQVYFFDTPDLLLSERGVIVRARRIQCGGGDSVVKLRPVVPPELPANFRRSRNLVVEVDAMPRSFVCSASLKQNLRAAVVQAAAAGRLPLRRLFTKEQRAFFDAHASDVKLDDLTVLGPVTVLKQKMVPVGFARAMSVELWLYPDVVPTLELSTKCRPSQALWVAAKVRRLLGEHGIDVSEEQEMKTCRTLGFFAQQSNLTQTNSTAQQRRWRRCRVIR